MYPVREVSNELGKPKSVWASCNKVRVKRAKAEFNWDDTLPNAQDQLEKAEEA